MTNGTEHRLSTAGRIQWVQELKSTTCIRDIKGSRTSSGVGKMMNSCMRQPGSFLQRPCFTEVHASGKSLICAALTSNDASKINNEHKNGGELLLMLSWEREAFLKERSMFLVYYVSLMCKGFCQDLGMAWVRDLPMRMLKSRNHSSCSIREQMFVINWATNTCQALSKELTV